MVSGVIIARVMPSFFQFQDDEWRGVETEGLTGGAFRFRLSVLETVADGVRSQMSRIHLLFGRGMMSLLAYVRSGVFSPEDNNGWQVKVSSAKEGRTLIVNGESRSDQPTHLLERGHCGVPQGCIALVEVIGINDTRACWLRPL